MAVGSRDGFVVLDAVALSFAHWPSGRSDTGEMV